jgi:hypothetical protein
LDGGWRRTTLQRVKSVWEPNDVSLILYDARLGGLILKGCVMLRLKFYNSNYTYNKDEKVSWFGTAGRSDPG